MAIVNVKERIEDRLCDEDNTWTNYHRSYSVLVDTPVQPLKSIRDAAGIPTMHAAYTTEDGDADLDAFLVKKEVRPHDYNLFNVQCFYTTNVPLARPVEYDYDVRFIQEAMTVDTTGAAITNSADEPFDPPPTHDRPVLVIRVKKNLATVVTAVYENRLRTVNDAGYLGFAAGEVYFEDFKATFRREMGYEYYEILLTFLVDTRLGWQARFLDVGYRERLIGAGGEVKYRPIFSELDAQPLSRPRLLDGAGRKLVAGAVPVFRNFTTRASTDFTLL